MRICMLRVLQEREFERVGGTDTIKVDVRVITATNRDLEDSMVHNIFRRNSALRVECVSDSHAPPARSAHGHPGSRELFVEKYGRAAHKNVRRISTPAIDMLCSYHWPGNVR